MDDLLGWLNHAEEHKRIKGRVEEVEISYPTPPPPPLAPPSVSS